MRFKEGLCWLNRNLPQLFSYFESGEHYLQKERKEKSGCFEGCSVCLPTGERGKKESQLMRVVSASESELLLALGGQQDFLDLV